MSHQPLTDAELRRRMVNAARAEGEGACRRAARLYERLGKDIQARCGRFDPRALDAFEGMARAIRKSTDIEEG
ncbi:hypothetical protein [Streptomyces sp. NPDC087298]|uniref:hypothetical protein n=1 Tax=Streptomyces sp. NPDC087298 TaxID=3365779 RepID=UPI00382A8EEA